MTETPTLEDAVRDAIATFERYADLHRAEATPEGTAKAEACELEAAKLRDALAAQSQGREELREAVYNLVGEASAKAWFAGGACVKDPEDTTPAAQSDEKDAQVTDAIMSLLPRSLPVEVSEEALTNEVLERVGAMRGFDREAAPDVDAAHREWFSAVVSEISDAIDARPVKAKALEWRGPYSDGSEVAVTPAGTVKMVPNPTNPDEFQIFGVRGAFVGLSEGGCEGAKEFAETYMSTLVSQLVEGE